MRVACLLVAELPLAAALRADPELAHHPLAIATGPGPRAEVLCVSPSAASQGVRAFTTVVQARATCAELRVRATSHALEAATRAALFDLALSASPRVEAAPPAAGLYAAEAAVFLDVSGCKALFRSEAGLAAALEARAARLGLPLCIAIASTRPTAHLAARQRARRSARESSLQGPSADRSPSADRGAEPCTGVEIVQDDVGFLAPLPLDLLDPDPALADALARFGIRRIGELTRLPERALVTRLGAAVRPLLALARGAPHPAIPEPSATLRCEEALDLEHPLERLEPLGFVLRGLLSRLAERLDCRGLVCGDLELRLALEGGHRDARRVGVAAPTGDVRVLLRLVTLCLESRPPEAAIEAVALSSEGRPVRADQLDLFRPAGPAPALLARTVAELEALCGPGRVGAPARADSHRPDAWALARFAPATAEPCRPRQTGPGELSLRALRPPVVAQVRLEAGRPAALRSAVANGHITGVAGPWRSSGAWWSREERFAFDHFDVGTSDGSLCRLRFDLVHRRWEIDAVYD